MNNTGQDQGIKMHTIFEVLQGRHPTGELECAVKHTFIGPWAAGYP